MRDDYKEGCLTCSFLPLGVASILRFNTFFNQSFSNQNQNQNHCSASPEQLFFFLYGRTMSRAVMTQLLLNKAQGRCRK